MLYSVRGPLLHQDGHIAVVECGGIGFQCSITMNTARKLPPVGQEVMLYTVMNVREDAVDLFGFAERSELICFKQLTAVSGVGPKVAIAILSVMSPDKVTLSVMAGDYKALTAAPGVGTKLAQRLVLELKDKMGSLAGEELPAVASGVTSAADNAAVAVRTLTSLGFTAGEASMAVGRLDSALPVETLVRDALKSLARKG